MVVIDSSAIIPLARIGELSLLGKVFQEVSTVEEVRKETVEPGKRGSSRIEEGFQNLISVQEVDEGYEKIGELEGIVTGDAKVIMLAEKREEPVLANDRALVQVARSRENTVLWPTTVIIKAVKEDVIEPGKGRECVKDMVSEGMNLSPQVYDRLIRELEK